MHHQAVLPSWRERRKVVPLEFQFDCPLILSLIHLLSCRSLRGFGSSRLTRAPFLARVYLWCRSVYGVAAFSPPSPNSHGTSLSPLQEDTGLCRAPFWNSLEEPLLFGAFGSEGRGLGFRVRSPVNPRDLRLPRSLGISLA